MDKTQTQTDANSIDAQPQHAEIVRSMNAFAEAFNAGRSAEAMGWYSDDAVWILSNGQRLEGAEAIGGFVQKGIDNGAKAMDLAPPKLTVAGDVAYVRQSFGFDLKPGVRIKGQRIALVVRDTDPKYPWRVRRDVWLPESAESKEEVSSAIQAKLGGLASSTNRGDAQELAGLYSADATVVLSNGAVFNGQQLPGFLEKVAKSGIDDMHFDPAQVKTFDANTAWSMGRFSVTLPVPGQTSVALQGERITVWRRAEGVWSIDLEISWPSPTELTSVEAGGVEFSWALEGDRLIGQLKSSGKGWVCVGFNTKPNLDGSRLIMASATGDRVTVEEHIARPPQHWDIGADTIVDASGHGSEEGTVIDFVLDARALEPAGIELEAGKTYHLTLAWSREDDFQHHSAFRTMVPVRL